MVKLGNYVFTWYRLNNVPETKGFIKDYNLRKILSKAIDLHLADSRYRLYSFEDMKQVIEIVNQFKLQPYIAEDRDCDDFSKSLLGDITKVLIGAPFGIVWVDVYDEFDTYNYSHAINFFVDDKKRLWFVEPQNNNIFRPPKNWIINMMVV